MNSNNMLYNSYEKKSRGGKTMIYEFTFENYRSYKNEATIDFISKPINEFEETLINVGNSESLLPVCAIYGPNGGGKSSVIMALNELRMIVMQPLLQLAFMKKKNEELGETSIEQLKESLTDIHTNSAYYKWDANGVNKPTIFNILFQVDDFKYRYEFEIQNEMIIVENLYMEKEKNVEVVFERDSEGVYLCELLDGVDLENMNESLPLLSYIGMFKNIDVIDRVIRFFMQIRVLNYDKPNLDKRIFVKQIENDKCRLCNVMQSMGIDICDINVEYSDDGSVEEIYTIHRLLTGEEKKLRLAEESSGTKKIISIIPILLNGIDHDSLFLIDELDAKLHPLLLRKIIELFTNRNINKGSAQLLFTSHDLTTMSKDVFRRDEIWFSAINGYDESILYSLVDFRKEGGSKPRNDENYSKQYLEGRYGADPYFRKLVDWEVVD